MSVQANAGSYCTPRQDFAERYLSVEVGYPNEKEPLLMPYCEEPDDPTDTVYPFVPATTIYLVIAKHGGMKYGELPLGIPCPTGWNCENR
tara:strand:- start:3879 stop:4148 length:270 start_codon:yes stop_codon:yes gene_type:complete